MPEWQSAEVESPPIGRCVVVVDNTDWSHVDLAFFNPGRISGMNKDGTRYVKPPKPKWYSATKRGRLSFMPTHWIVLDLPPRAPMPFPI